jgi:hypothetical protein
MAGITLAQAQSQLAAWLEADAAVAKGQAYAIAGRSVTRADAAVISEKIAFWDRRVKQLQGGGSGGNRVRHGVMIP